MFNPILYEIGISYFVYSSLCTKSTSFGEYYFCFPLGTVSVQKGTLKRYRFASKMEGDRSIPDSQVVDNCNPSPSATLPSVENPSAATPTNNASRNSPAYLLSPSSPIHSTPTKNDEAVAVVPDDIMDLSAVCSQPAIGKKLKRFRFLETYDVFLLRAVRVSDAHIPEHGQTDALYGKVLTAFMEQVPAVVFTNMHRPSKKTLSDRFKRLVQQRRQAVKVNLAASGIIEPHGDKEVLLDDLILEIDEKEEASRAEKDERKETERKLIAAGDSIRTQALQRKSTDPSVDDTVDGRDSAKKRKRRSEVVISDDDVTSSILQQSSERQTLEHKRIEIEEKRLELDRIKDDREREQFTVMQDERARRLALDERKFELDKEERRLAMEERKSMVEIMGLLEKKLQ